MQINKPEIIFTFPATMGGVASFNFNIINNSSLLKHFYSKVILMYEVSDKSPLFTEQFNTDEQIFFEYSDKENQYHLQKRLNVILGNNNGAIVTDNGLTIEAANRFRNPKTIFSLLHDYYYVNQQIKLENLADVAIAHSSFFSDAVFASNPDIWVDRTFYIPYGVKQLEEFPKKNKDVLKVVFLGRLEISKGVLKLIDIQHLLHEKKVEVQWTIIGKGSLKGKLLEQWKNETISFYEPDSTDEVYNILKQQDIFIFPTTFEGTPVSILEALACGVVTVVNDLPGGIRDIVTNGIGYRCTANNTEEFANYIETLSSDRKALTQMQHHCFELAHSNYNITMNADKYVEMFVQYKRFKRNEKSPVKLLKRLDNPLFPNWFTTLIRKIK